MSKMKHLLRKLHIGGDYPPPHHHHSPPPPPPPPPPPEEQSTAVEAVDFNFLEEEFQVQLALAISASDTDGIGGGGGGDVETAQIKAAKQISLGRSPIIEDGPIESLSLSYWSYNFVNYDEKVMDGFYDVYTPSNPTVQGKMPLLQDLQEIPNSDNIEYEVVSVNRVTDPNLCQLEEIVYAASMEHRVLENGQTINCLIQKIADLVVHKMGGPVNNADEMLKMWNVKSYELRTSLNSIVLPLGCIDVGLSRHRALLFKVLADRINLPCMLVKGSYYTGTDEGAVNLIKFDSRSYASLITENEEDYIELYHGVAIPCKIVLCDGKSDIVGRLALVLRKTIIRRYCEFVIDLMGAPGALIPAELSSDHLQNSDLNIKSCSNYSETIKDLCPVLQEGNQVMSLFETSGSTSGEGSGVKVQSKNRARDLYNANQTEKFETDFGSLFPSFCRSNEGLSSNNRKTSDAQKLKVDDVSKYVISASENPQFAHKLHAVLVESGSSESIDFLLGVLPHNVKDMDKKLEKIEPGYDFMSSKLGCPDDTTDETFKLVNNENNSPVVADRLGNCLFPFATELNEGECKENLIGGLCFEDKKGKETDNIESKNSLALINPLLGDASSWEISWEELQIGERIGLGSFGEVYHAEWNSTEVAVKKFMDQDISGDALTQFKCEVEIMLRLRHPNLVLFMGAVTRPPNLSILTEYLPRGSLFKLLHRPNNHLNEKKRLRMAIDVAKGMNYLHTSHPTIVHRDLKTPNLLVDKNWVVKVCDFGLSRLKHHAFLSSKSAAGTPEWMAPEVLRNEQSNEKSDVYSFGVILWELSTLRVPWSGMNSMQVIGAVGFQDRHLDITDDIDPTVAEIILQCWHPKSQMRPSFGDLIKRLRRLQRLQCPVAQITKPQSG